MWRISIVNDGSPLFYVIIFARHHFHVIIFREFDDIKGHFYPIAEG